MRPTRNGGYLLLAICFFLGVPSRGDEPHDAPAPRDSDAVSVSDGTSVNPPPKRVTLWARWIGRMRTVRATPSEGGPRAQESSGDQRRQSPPEPDGTSKSGATNMTVPKTERGIGGAQPSLREEVKQQDAPGGAPEAPTPLYLNRALGLEDSPVRTYGWIENTFTGNANGTPLGLSNFSVFPNNLANQWQGNQYYLVVENPLEPDDMVNLGFRIDTLFGNDWQFTREYGLFTNAFTPNQFAGLDIPQIYGEIHLPILTPGGVDIKGGRFYSPAGYFRRAGDQPSVYHRAV